MSSEDWRVLALRCAVAFGIAWGGWCMRRAWSSQRQCPRAPLFRLPKPPWRDEIWLHMLAIGLVGNLLCPSPVSALALLACFGLTSCYDWTRFRPMFYQNFSLLLLLSLDAQAGLNACRLVLASIYFWAGLLKVNRRFANAVFPWVTEPVLRRLPQRLHALWKRLGTAAPWLECGIGVGLLFPATRTLALTMAAAMHTLILLCFSGGGHRTHPEVRPWNLSMLLAAWFAFARCPSVTPEQIVLGSGVVHWLVLVTFACVPVLGLVNRLDPVFSHGHMSGRHVYGSLHFAVKAHYKLPKAVRAHCVWEAGSAVHPYRLDLTDWYLAELHTPAPQQERLLRQIALEVTQGLKSADWSLRVQGMVGFAHECVPESNYLGIELSRRARLPIK